MKALQNISLLILIVSLFTFTSINAQSAPTTTSKNSVVKIKTSGECEMCKKTIEAEIGKMAGVKKVELDVETKVLTVEYNSKKTNPDKIRKAIAAIGYDADEVKANNRRQKELPACCQPGADSMPK